MKKYECKCGSKEIFIKDSGNNKGLYCADCGKWMQWLSKDALRLAERQIEQQNMCESCIHKVSADDLRTIKYDAVDELSIKCITHIQEAKPLTIEEIIHIIHFEADQMKGE